MTSKPFGSRVRNRADRCRRGQHVVETDSQPDTVRAVPGARALHVVDVGEDEHAVELLHPGFKHAGDLELPQLRRGGAVGGDGRDEQTS